MSVSESEKALMDLEEGARFSRNELAALLGWQGDKASIAGALGRMVKARTIEFDGYKRNPARPGYPIEAYRVGPRIRALRAERGSEESPPT